jgi:hypothetical protein
MAGGAMRHAMRHWAWLGMAALAAGCAAPQQAAAPPSPAAMITTPTPSPPQPQAETNVPVESLLYVRAAQVRARFGEPHETRRDGGAQVWNYEAEGQCRLNLVMQSLRRAPLTVVHAQARLTGETTDKACLSVLGRGGTGVEVSEPAPTVTPAAAPARRATSRPRPRARR